ncbi:unnamed protein product [Bursaphelenchus xylophilus]|uniref:(pine wood nematode) hypothetical protein n=1 Tax=Bursaphelenchus xylophilus TaxID=6326 RepID=A0A1I7SGW1_BURXY|nr:unnamed protein product [Bursaphelenchus xylophilus]CAG9100391.1 unnamed protein product [Bursaphelenchus xylophilus]
MVDNLVARREAEKALGIFEKYNTKFYQTIETHIKPKFQHWLTSPPQTDENFSATLDQLKKAELEYSSCLEQVEKLRKLTGLDEETALKTERDQVLLEAMRDLLEQTRKRASVVLGKVKLSNHLVESYSLVQLENGNYEWPRVFDTPLSNTEEQSTPSGEDLPSNQVQHPQVILPTNFTTQYEDQFYNELAASSSRPIVSPDNPASPLGQHTAHTNSSNASQGGTRNAPLQTQETTTAPTQLEQSLLAALVKQFQPLMQQAINDVMSKTMADSVHQSAGQRHQHQPEPDAERSSSRRRDNPTRRSSSRSRDDRRRRRRRRTRSYSSSSRSSYDSDREDRDHSPRNHRRSSRRVIEHRSDPEFDTRCAINVFQKGQFICKCKEYFEMRGSLTKGLPNPSVEKMKDSEHSTWLVFLTHFNIDVGNNPSFPPAKKNAFLRDRLLPAERLVAHIADPHLQSYTRTMQGHFSPS